MHLSGQLSDWSINDLLQIMQVTKKTGSLDIDAERRGRIHFKEGTVTGAELSGGNGTYRGEDRDGIADVLYVLSSLTDGKFAVGPADGPDRDGWSVEDVLADVESLRALEGDVVDAGLFEADGLRLVTAIEAPLSITPQDWASIVALVKPFDFTELETRSGRGGAVRILHTLHRLGVAEAAEPAEPTEPTRAVHEEPDDEAGWLDRLAEGIVPESGEPTWVEETSDQPSGEDDDDAASEESPVEPEPVRVATVRAHTDVRGVSAPASTTLTDGVYDEIRRLRSKVAEG